VPSAGRAVTAMLAAVALAACAAPSAHAPARPRATAHIIPAPSPPPTPGHLVGVYEPNDPGSYGQVAEFTSATGVTPGVVVYYSDWGAPFASAFAAQVHSRDGEPLIQIDPRGVALTAIAGGRQDGYLRSLAEQVRAYSHPVIVSFGQEMNGPWYPWGSGHTAPTVFIAAWRHLVEVFRAEGARNTIWLWDVNCANFPGGTPISAWWPGQGYVTWAGVDCYYFRPSYTFTSMFGATITAIRRLTADPILIAETAVGPVAGPGKIADLFAGATQANLLGVVWFDEAQDAGIYHQDWRLEDSPQALAVFSREAKAYRSVPGQ
jgi:mannan endo-1,4-beta-mannosidase